MEGEGSVLERMIKDCLSKEVILSQPRKKLGDFRHRKQQIPTSCSLSIIIRTKCAEKKMSEIMLKR